MTRVDRLLRPFADVRAGEGRTALLLALNVFLLLTAYYVLKPVRDALILGQGTAELKAYMSGAQVALLLVAVPLYGRLVDRLPRRTLINAVTYFFVGCLIAFYALGQAHVPIAAAYFVWIGVFNLMIVAQFWSFANDIYSKDEGERLFPIIGFGASAGAVIGAFVAAGLVRSVGVYQLLLLGAALLALQLQITNFVDRRRPHVPATQQTQRETSTSRAPHVNPFAMVFRTRYLLLIAVMLMLLSTVDSVGEYLLGSLVEDSAKTSVLSGQSQGLGVEAVIGSFYSRYYALVNVLSLFIQLFVVSRIVKHIGVSSGVIIQPILSLVAYTVLAFSPGLWIVLAAKVSEKSADYSLSNTIRNMLFLPCTREEKYSAKQAIDSFFYRMGDVFTALIVFTGTALGLSASRYAIVNVLLASLWLCMAFLVGREYLVRTQVRPERRVTQPIRAKAS
jgi:AAA family ATP:ADP antiporter